MTGENSFQWSCPNRNGFTILVGGEWQRLLLECGFFQGNHDDSLEKNRQFLYDPKMIDAVVLSHAHIDHSGNLPNLVSNGFRGPIYATKPTAKLAEIMLLDSGHIQEETAAFFNKKRSNRGLPPIEPIYTREDAAQVAQYFHSVHYGEEFEPIPGVTARLVDAGHILGSAAIVLDITEKGRKPFRFWFSGDIGRLKLPLMRDPVLPENADILIMECTYGDKPHRDPEEAYIEFRQTLMKTIRRGGKVIIPAFSVGRTQELVFDLNRMLADGDIPAIPVYVDSPLAVSATDIFRQFTTFLMKKPRHSSVKKNIPALTFPSLTYTRSVEESKQINEKKDPMVIISASGMAESGRILHHLKNNIEDERNTIVIVSWQAPDTRGRQLAEQEKEIHIFGEKFIRRAEVATIGGLSAHAGQDFLLEYAQASAGTLKKIFLVHGEKQAAEPLMGKLAEQTRVNVDYPWQYQVVEI